MPIEKNCDTCGDVFEVQPYRSDTARFCSHDCRAAWQSDAYEGEDGPNYRGGKTEYECPSCGQTVEDWDSQTGSNRFCSKSCYGDWLSENHRRENHPNFVGGMEHYNRTITSDEWETIASNVRERDGHKCRRCGLTQSESRDQFNKILAVHHKKTVDEFDDPSKAHDPENFITLCMPCHVKVEWETGAIDDDVPKQIGGNE